MFARGLIQQQAAAGGIFLGSFMSDHFSEMGSSSLYRVYIF